MFSSLCDVYSAGITQASTFRSANWSIILLAWVARPICVNTPVSKISEDVSSLNGRRQDEGLGNNMILTHLKTDCDVLNNTIYTYP